MERNAMIITLLTILGLLFLASSVEFKGGGLHQLLFQGFLTLSLDKVEFRSSDPRLNDEVFVITILQGGTGQRLEGTIEVTPDVIESFTGKKVEKKLVFDVKDGEQYCEYEIVPKYWPMPTPIYTYTLRTWRCLWYDENYARNSQCTAWKKGGEFLGGGPYAGGCYCVEGEKEVGIIGEVDAPYVRTKATFVLSIDGESIEKQIDTKGAIDAWFDNIAYLRWDGYVVKDACKSPHPYYAFYKDGKWRIGYKESYEDYKAARLDLINYLSEGGPGTFGSIRPLQEKVNLVNTKASIAMLEDTSLGEIANAEEERGAIVKRAVNSWVQAPLYTLIVKAKELWVYQPVSKPRIEGIDKYEDHTTVVLTVKVRNVGDERGVFNVWAECTVGAEQVRNSREVYIDPGELKSVELKVSKDVEKEIESTCKVCARSISGEDCKTIRVTFRPFGYCVPGSMKCGFRNGLWTIEKCNEYGSGYDVVEWCEPDEICKRVDSEYKCVKKEEGGGIIPPTPEKCDWGNPLTWGTCISMLIQSAKPLIFLIVIGIILFIAFKALTAGLEIVKVLKGK